MAKPTEKKQVWVFNISSNCRFWWRDISPSITLLEVPAHATQHTQADKRGTRRLSRGGHPAQNQLQHPFYKLAEKLHFPVRDQNQQHRPQLAPESTRWHAPASALEGPPGREQPSQAPFLEKSSEYDFSERRELDGIYFFPGGISTQFLFWEACF